MITCSYCQTSVEEQSRFCDHCGKLLRPVSGHRTRILVFDLIELIVAIVTIHGLITSAYWVYAFLRNAAPAVITISNVSLAIQGIPFSNIVYGLFEMAIGGAYYSIRSVCSMLYRRYISQTAIKL
jgi:hypothetical protein